MVETLENQTRNVKERNRLEEKGNQDWVKNVIFSKQGDKLASFENDGIIGLWDSSSGKLIKTFKGHQGLVTSLVFNPANVNQLATSGVDGTVRLWDWSGNRPSKGAGLDALMAWHCKWVRDYLENNPNVSESDRHLCDDIGTQK